MTTALPWAFNAAEAPKKLEGGNLLPTGQYLFAIEGGEVKATNDGNGEYIQLDLLVVDGEHSGSSLKPKFNIVNSNELAVKIGLSELGELCDAVGVPVMDNLTQIFGKRVIGNVRLQNQMRKNPQTGQKEPQLKDDGTPWQKSVVTKYVSFNSAAPKPAAAPAPAAAATGGAPWKK